MVARFGSSVRASRSADVRRTVSGTNRTGPLRRSDMPFPIRPLHVYFSTWSSFANASAVTPFFEALAGRSRFCAAAYRTRWTLPAHHVSKNAAYAARHPR